MKAALLLLAVALIHCASAGGNFDLATAKKNVYLAFSSYCGQNVDQYWDCYWCNNLPGFTWVSNFGDSTGNFFGFGGYFASTQEIVIAIRGTDNVAGWIADARFKKVPFANVPDALVHKGFYDAWNDNSYAVMGVLKNISSLCPGCSTVSVTGHSLGAALATLAALEIQLSNSSFNVVMYNFGSPRVGNQAFATYADNILHYDVYRVVNKRDLVTKIPLRSMSYYHLAEEIWWNGKTWSECNMSGEDSSCSDSQTIGNPFDHGVYVGVNTLDGVSHGCMWTDPSAK